MNPADVVEYIGDTSISHIPVNTGLTNSKILGDNVEDNVRDEGKILFDIRFTAFALLIKEKIEKILINVEIQNSMHQIMIILRKYTQSGCV